VVTLGNKTPESPLAVTPKPPEPQKRSKAALPEEMVTFASRLAVAMKHENLNATQLAKLSGVSVPVITRALRGERRDGMYAVSVIRIAKALGVRVGWLLAAEEPMLVGAIVESAQAEAIVRATLSQIGYPTSSQMGSYELERPAKSAK